MGYIYSNDIEKFIAMSTDEIAKITMSKLYNKLKEINNYCTIYTEMDYPFCELSKKIIEKKYEDYQKKGKKSEIDDFLIDIIDKYKNETLENYSEILNYEEKNKIGY